MSVSRPTGDQLEVFYCSSIPVMMFDTPGISMCLNILFLLCLHLCFIIGFICNIFVARHALWMRYKTPTRTKQIYGFTTLEAEDEGWDPVKQA